ncbi:MAG TPA: TonB-dependent receptor plug domain-containing protein, partial [Dongiaceae bacterium]|nr:TonB-dependent receptor plug domain-containing protein [Dongiaceae bacterium]
MKLPLFVAIAGAACASSAVAENTIQLAEVYTPGLADEVVVTASRSPQQLQDTLASTTLITREQIEKSQARDLYQLLRTVPGVSVKRNGGRGSSTSLSMRGGEASGTLILVDGVNVESATLGEVALQQISIDQIDRIEVTRGPKSSLYGSSAMNGVVQIFTRKAAPKNGVTYSAGLGSDNTRDGTISASGLGDTNRYNATLSYVESDGFDSMYLDDTVSSSDRYNYDDDGYHRAGASLNIEQDFSDILKGSVMFNKSQGQAEYDNRFLMDRMPHTEFESSVATTALTLDLTEFTSKLQYGLVKDLSENFNDMPDYTSFETRRNVGSWENSWSAIDWLTVNFGADYTHEE